MKNKSIRYTVIAIVLFAIAVLILFFINGDETKTSRNNAPEDVTSLYCVAGSIENEFFVPTNVNTIQNEIKVTFRDDKLDKVFYTYTGVYRSNDVAEHDNALLHAKYNIYFGEKNSSPDILSPVFSVVNTKFRITLFLEKIEDLNEITAEFFFVDKSEIKSYLEQTRNETKSFYEKKGFTCSLID